MRLPISDEVVFVNGSFTKEDSLTRIQKWGEDGSPCSVVVSPGAVGILFLLMFTPCILSDSLSNSHFSFLVDWFTPQFASPQRPRGQRNKRETEIAFQLTTGKKNMSLHGGLYHTTVINRKSLYAKPLAPTKRSDCHWWWLLNRQVDSTDSFYLTWTNHQYRPQQEMREYLFSKARENRRLFSWCKPMWEVWFFRAFVRAADLENSLYYCDAEKTYMQPESLFLSLFFLRGSFSVRTIRWECKA